jgi:hypothetical protein
MMTLKITKLKKNKNLQTKIKKVKKELLHRKKKKQQLKRQLLLLLSSKNMEKNKMKKIVKKKKKLLMYLKQQCFQEKVQNSKIQSLMMNIIKSKILSFYMKKNKKRRKLKI